MDGGWMDVCLKVIIDWKSNPEKKNTHKVHAGEYTVYMTRMRREACKPAATAALMGVFSSHVSGRAVHIN